MDYELELDRVVSEIKKQKAKLVCLQLPEGLVPRAAEIQKEIKAKTNAKVMIWLGSCFGACDVPDLSKQKVDLLIQFGHSEWR